MIAGMVHVCRTRREQGRIEVVVFLDIREHMAVTECEIRTMTGPQLTLALLSRYERSLFRCARLNVTMCYPSCLTEDP